MKLTEGSKKAVLHSVPILADVLAKALAREAAVQNMLDAEIQKRVNGMQQAALANRMVMGHSGTVGAVGP